MRTEWQWCAENPQGAAQRINDLTRELQYALEVSAFRLPLGDAWIARVKELLEADNAPVKIQPA
jgi:hypothetical protein